MRYLLLVSLILSMVTRASGQHTVPACTAGQFETLRQIVVDFLNNVPGQEESLDDLSQWQRDVWQQPGLPDCAAAFEALPLMTCIVEAARIVKFAAAADDPAVADSYVGEMNVVMAQLRSLVGETADGQKNAEVGRTSSHPTAEEIISFSVTPATVDRGDTVTINWEVRGKDDVSIYLYHALQRFPGNDTVNLGGPLPLRGTITYVIPDLPITMVSFSPVWPPDGEKAIRVKVRCPYAFFVEPQSNPCPVGEVASLPAAYQAFQYGFMVWHSGYVWMFDDTGHGIRFVDQWKEGDTVAYDAPPPSGLLVPQRGFGKVWIENEFVRDRLDWATTPEQGYTTRFQASQVSWSDFSYYFTLLDGRVAYLEAGFNSFTWRYLP